MSESLAGPARIVPYSTRGPRLVATLGIVSVLTAAGCLTRTVENEGLVAIAAPTDTTAFGAMHVSPEARAQGLRISRFINTGSVDERQSLRKTADRAMSAACSGSYRPGAEGPDAVDGIVTPRAQGTMTGPSPYWYVQFTCVRDGSTGTNGSRS
jgi:hypothetical protein